MAGVSPQDQHAALTRAAVALGMTRSTMTNMVSAHYSTTSVSFAALERFLETASTIVREQKRFNLGSIGGELLISIDLRPSIPPPPSQKSKKRSYDDSGDRAQTVVAAARKRLTHDQTITNEMLDVAQKHIESMFRNVKGSNNELVFESLGLSVTPTTLVNSSASSSQPTVSARPKLIVACRLSAGIAVPVYPLRAALTAEKAFPDGMMTTNPDSLGPEYRLPLTELGRAADANGQRSILLFSAVPQPKPKDVAA